jgi:hypothetical protein
MQAMKDKIWTVADASKILDIKRTTLYSRAYKLGLLKKRKLMLSDDDIERMRTVREYKKRVAKL